MQQLRNPYEGIPIGVHCIALYKVSVDQGLSLNPGMHMYLAGVLTRMNDPKQKKINSQFVVSSTDELGDIVEEHEKDPQPNTIPFIVGKTSGDFFLNWNAMIIEERDSFLPSFCYSIAQIHGEKAGREYEAQILGLLALSIDKYIQLLAEHYKFLRANPDFKLTEDNVKIVGEWV